MESTSGDSVVQLTCGQKIGNFTTLENVGSGSFGTVYLMHHDLMNRDSAVKFVENQDPNRFVAHFEAQILDQCKHDRIVSVYGVDVVADHAGTLFAAIEMEYISGGSAAKLLGQHVSIRKAIKIIIDTLFALEHAHTKNVLHRDVKPANIMLVGERAKLTDFGLATDGASALTASGAGSPVYCAPEVINDALTNVTTDVFATGMTLFQLINNYKNLAAKIHSLDTIRFCRVIPSIGYRNYVPRRLRLICNRACNAEPAKRYQSAREFRQALESLRIRQDWNQVSADHWSARIGKQVHELRAIGGGAFQCLYTINGRRRNVNCSNANSASAARDLVERWIYGHTF
ncbi:serine/threonine-protein kinase [Rhodopseudomonas sp. B29]|uniref:serine/threonine-protein kinase n=1 Tax=Rhodopseudomonas sp. B29 TaxID=95607 RepID=UPI000A03C2E3|nr:serine/threonine-protein kinase [Rhodopseudomonas sp. B29]